MGTPLLCLRLHPTYKLGDTVRLDLLPDGVNVSAIALWVWWYNRSLVRGLQRGFLHGAPEGPQPLQDLPDPLVFTPTARGEHTVVVVAHDVTCPPGPAYADEPPFTLDPDKCKGFASYSVSFLVE
jgi:hypothetical protein